MNDAELLRRLGLGHAIADVCQEAGLTREQFDIWWREQLSARVWQSPGRLQSAVTGEVEVRRDRDGVAHIFADNDRDLFYGFGWSMAHDRMFQLDFLRRKGDGRLAEVMGQAGLANDVLARTVGIGRTARQEWEQLDESVRELLSAFSAGINGWLAATPCLPIEFDLLDYRPEQWSPVDCLTIEGEFRWYLTGRFPVIVIPELVKRSLGDGDLYRAFLLGEEDAESILPDESPRPELDSQLEPVESGWVGDVTGFDSGVGSNNWVVSGDHSATGGAMVASDPHIAIDSVSCWYETHLSGGSFDTAGMCYVGVPAVMVGRNREMAWSITNNICSQRDLYRERTDPNHDGCFLYGDDWEPAQQRAERIAVRGQDPVEKTVRSSRNGPIVDELLPEIASADGPVSLRWLGSQAGGWLTAMLNMSRAQNVPEFREALRPWHVPTFSLLFADANGDIAYQSTGRIPLRRRVERGFRRGWDPADMWQGLIPFAGMPAADSPTRGWLATANNRIAADDSYPYPLSGTWVRGHRAVRIRQMIEQRIAAAAGELNGDDMRAWQADVLSLRAETCLPHLLAAIGDAKETTEQAAVEHLRGWDYQSRAEQTGPTLFNVFFRKWTRAVVAERFTPEVAAVVVSAAEGLASRLLADDELSWFTGGNRVEVIRQCFRDAVAELTRRFGNDVSEWRWERVHRLPLPHHLAVIGDLAELLNQAPRGVGGDMGTVFNTGSDPNLAAATGGGYRMYVDLGEEPAGIWQIDGQSQSGNPGSPHYGDQLDAWIAGQYHRIPLDRDHVEAVESISLQPVD